MDPKNARKTASLAEIATVAAPPATPAVSRETARRTRLDELKSTRLDVFSQLDLGDIAVETKPMTAVEKAEAQAKEKLNYAAQSGVSFDVIAKAVLGYRGTKVSELRTMLEDRCSGSKGALNKQIDIVLAGFQAKGWIKVDKGAGKGFRNYTK